MFAELEQVDILATGGLIALSMVSVALFLAATRLFRGPTLADRVVALELIASLMVGVVALIAVISDQGVLIDVAIAVTLVGFIGAVGLARYMEKGTTRKGPTE
jgi:multicomponent Na+:H+ antiporter subunit F